MSLEEWIEGIVTAAILAVPWALYFGLMKP